MYVIFDRSHVTLRNVQARFCCQQDSLQAYIERCHLVQTHRLQYTRSHSSMSLDMARLTASDNYS